MSNATKTIDEATGMVSYSILMDDEIRDFFAKDPKHEKLFSKFFTMIQTAVFELEKPR